MVCENKVDELCAKLERKIKRLNGLLRKCLSGEATVTTSGKQQAGLLRSRVRELERLLNAVRTDESFCFGRANCRAAIFVYKRDATIADVWPIVERMDRAQNLSSCESPSISRMHAIRFELHRSRQRFLDGLEKWNRSVGPRNSYLCIYCHGKEGGISAQDPETVMPRFVSWEALARALPLGVRYLWLVGCSTSGCLQVWSRDKSPVRHRLLAANEDRYFGRLVRLFAKEIDIADIGFDDEMMARLRKADPELAKSIKYFDFPDDQRALVTQVPLTHPVTVSSDILPGWSTTRK
jgi:hypothetical protein